MLAISQNTQTTCLELLFLILQQVTYYWWSYNVLCSHVAAIMNFGGHIDFQVGVQITDRFLLLWTIRSWWNSYSIETVSEPVGYLGTHRCVIMATFIWLRHVSEEACHFINAIQHTYRLSHSYLTLNLIHGHTSHYTRLSQQKNPILILQTGNYKMRGNYYIYISTSSLQR